MKKIAIIEPHYDDAWINMGGFILNNKEDNITLITFSKYPTNNKFNLNKLKKLCPNINHLDLSYLSLGFEDEFDIKFRQTYEFSSDFELFLKMNSIDNPSLIKKQFYNLLNNMDVVYWPLGLKHPQHILMEYFLPNLDCKVYLYREYPYFFYEDQKKLINSFLNKNLKVQELNIKKLLDKKIKYFKLIYPEQSFILNLNIGSINLCNLENEVFWELK